MSNGVFGSRSPIVKGNTKIRIPQQEAYDALRSFASAVPQERESGVVLPVGCGKSGCITLAPFAFGANRVLVVAPGLRIAKQLSEDFDATRSDMFYAKTGALVSPPYPEPVEIRGTSTNRGDLDESEVVVTNIQQLQGGENRWLSNLPEDYFDLILFDEGHHSVAATWEGLRTKFPNARVVNFSATPLRADGQRMGGRIVYSYPVSRAIREGYVKRLKALVLNPRTLKYVRRDGGQEVEVPLEEVRRLGEEEADFRRSIVTSAETLNTIVDASIRELERIRVETGDHRHKIIASALNFQHCIQIVEAYRRRGKRADYVHSREDSPVNDRVFSRLDNNELDVIVQVRKLSEGFDHPYLTVAAVFSIFSNLSPFVQFVGRIMRVIVHDSPGNVQNQGAVVFHAGANVARRWEDFQEYSEADQRYFEELLPVEGLDFEKAEDIEVVPSIRGSRDEVEVRDQGSVFVEEIPLIEDDPAAMDAINTLRERGYSAETVRRAMELQPVPTTRVRERQAARSRLDSRVKNEVGRILGERGLSPEGHELDRKRLGRTNFVVLKSAIDREVNHAVGRGSSERHEFTRPELDLIENEFVSLVSKTVGEVFDG